MSRHKKNKIHTNESVYIKHNKKYSHLLDVFIKNTKASNRLKNRLKVLFFVIIILIMVALCFLFGYSVYSTFKIIKDLDAANNESTESIVGAVVSIVPSLATMLVSLIKLPKIIAEYLFNPQEDENMVKIIGQIQNYDLQMYNLEQQANKLLEKQQGDDFKKFDDTLNSFLLENVEMPQNDNSKSNSNNNPSPSGSNNAV